MLTSVPPSRRLARIAHPRAVSPALPSPSYTSARHHVPPSHSVLCNTSTATAPPSHPTNVTPTMTPPAPLLTTQAQRATPNNHAPPPTALPVARHPNTAVVPNANCRPHTSTVRLQLSARTPHPTAHSRPTAYQRTVTSLPLPRQTTHSLTSSARTTTITTRSACTAAPSRALFTLVQ